MNLATTIGIIALLYVVNILTVEIFLLRPLWIVYVPGLPMAVVIWYLVRLLLCLAIAVLFGVGLGVAVVVTMVRCLLEMLKNKPPLPGAFLCFW